ncbi:MAG: GDP-mannose 4,6-dehydratase [Candidatus Neomarinimicrobiota bacterium]|jgi:UDP-glucose 4-epimerase|nr:GDP-mannose 4,6-dehydratase [Candidatus Neomarinimicrobiota bacterium]|tara:strand:- start:288 stop:1229 length:942 start_codon:yes stop_codon:yes gene_type:complete
MKILITGGIGFIGSHLVDLLLQENHKIIVLTKSYSKKKNISHIHDKIKVEKVDVTNHRKLSTVIGRHKPDVIIHLAGITSHSKSFEKPFDDIDQNAKSTLFILEKLRQMNHKCRFVLGSSFIVVGKPDKLPVDEKTPCWPTTIYGTNRLASEHYCKIYHEVYGLDTVIFRITNSFGPREQVIPTKNAVNFLIHEAFKGNKLTIFKKGKFFRDLIYISDVISGIKTIMTKGKSGDLYWISSGKKTWFYQLGELLEQLTEAKVKFVKTPKYTKKVDVGNFVVNNSKLKSLGWKPKVNLNAGIEKTLEYFKLHKIS